MKIKSLLIFSLLSILSFQSFAYDGKGYKILSEKFEKSSDVIQGEFLPNTRSDKPGGLVEATSHASDTTARHGENYRLTGQHGFKIYNRTDQNQIYIYKFELNCAGQYIRKTDYVEIVPGGYFHAEDLSYLTSFKTAAGQWIINAVTEVTGESSDSHVAQATLTLT